MKIESLDQISSDVDFVMIHGIPGSGKSTLANQLDGFTHLEADMFMYEDGVYNFDPTKLKDAHRWCEDQAHQALERGERVVISNTSILAEHRKPYFDFVKELGKKAVVLEAQGKFDNIHGVPEEAVQRMKDSFEEFHPSELYNFDFVNESKKTLNQSNRPSNRV